MSQIADRPALEPPLVQAAGAGATPVAPLAAPRSPAIGARELGLVLLGAVTLALVMSWPLVLELDRRIVQDLGDPIRTAWQIAWEGHALRSRALSLFDANAFWPQPGSLAFSDALLGYAPAGLVGAGAEAATTRLNVLFLLARALAFAGAYLLSRELGAGRAGAAAAGAAFAYAPFRLAMNGHLHVISSGGIPLALFLLVRGHRGARPSLVLAGWLVVSWQLTLGFTLGLQLGYLLLALAAIGALAWIARGRPAPSRRVVAASAAGVALVAGVAATLAGPYLDVRERFAGAERSEALVSLFSPPPRGLLAAPPESLIWGEATAGLRATLPMSEEQSLFPGAAILALAGVGAMAGRGLSPRLRGGLVAASAATAVLSLGFALADGQLGYRLLFEHAPGWAGVRTPGRIATLTSLGLALLAGAGAGAIVRRAARARGRAGPLAAPAAAALALGAVLADGAGRLPRATVPAAPAERMAQPAPTLHAPTNDNLDRLYMLWSTEGFRPMTNGMSTFARRELLRGRRAVRGFPDRASVARLRALGVRTVVLHLDVERIGFPPAGNEPIEPEPAWVVARRPVRGLGIRRRPLPGALVYDLRPPAAERGARER